MPGLITCPNCNTQFQPTDAFREEVQRELNNKAKEWQAKKEEEYKQREALLQQELQAKDIELNKKINEEKQKLQKELQESIRRSVSADYENQLKLLQQAANDNEGKLKEARRRELEFLQKEQALKNKEAELELSLQKKLLEERERLSNELRKIEEQKIAQKEIDFQLRLAEYEKKMKDQEKLINEMKRKVEQGSMQLQGEAQELALQDMLKSAFPFDVVCEVGKGVRGADCLLTIRNNFGQECGKIIFESKRTQNFGVDWIEKLKADKISVGADLAVLVTQTMPRDLDRFGEKEGIWVCTYP